MGVIRIEAGAGMGVILARPGESRKVTGVEYRAVRTDAPLERLREPFRLAAMAGGILVAAGRRWDWRCPPPSAGEEAPETLGLMLTAIKLLHTVVWALFVACILGIFAAAASGRFGLAASLIGVVMFEVAVLLLNRMRCPLTGIAAKYTSERADNFDIYLPLWLARYNQAIFGTLYVLGILFSLLEWLRHRAIA